MSYTRIKYGGDGMPYNYSEFMCDAESDLSSLPISGNGEGCAIASKAFVVATQKKYILNNSREWVELTSSGSSSEIDSDSIATVSEVTDYLGI